MNYILLGALGGLIPDIIRLIKAGNKRIYSVPEYLKKGFFYIILFLQVCLGALLVYLLKVHDELQAVVYGYAAPQLFVSFAAGVAAKQQSRILTESLPRLSGAARNDIGKTASEKEEYYKSMMIEAEKALKEFIQIKSDSIAADFYS